MDLLLGIASLLVSDHQDLFALKTRHAAEQRRIIAKAPVAMDFAPIGTDVLDIVKSVGSLSVAGQFRLLPGSKARLNLASQRLYLGMKATQLLARVLVFPGNRFQVSDLSFDRLKILLRLRWRIHSFLG